MKLVKRKIHSQIMYTRESVWGEIYITTRIKIRTRIWLDNRRLLGHIIGSITLTI